MYIKQIIDPETHGYGSITEADIVVTDGEYELMCYYYDINGEVKEGMPVKEVSTLFAVDIMRLDEKKYLVQKNHGKGEHYSYYLHGKVLDKTVPLIGIGELVIELDAPLPKDIEQGEFVEFKVGRLDCYI